MSVQGKLVRKGDVNSSPVEAVKEDKVVVVVRRARRYVLVETTVKVMMLGG